MTVRNISKKVKYYMKIHRNHKGKTIVVHNLKTHLRYFFAEIYLCELDIVLMFNYMIFKIFIIINKFDTYSEIRPDYCMDCPA